MNIQLYDTQRREKCALRPIDPAAVRMYVCGPTVWDFAHIGNARPAIVFDLLFRLLRSAYQPEHVFYARNVTDVDDKINARAARDFPDRPLDLTIAQVTAETTKQYEDDVRALNCLEPNASPRATDHIPEMTALIERLIERGFAYVAADHVLFSPAAMDKANGLPKYGSLSRRPLDEMIAGARVDVAPYKRDPVDFVLWKPSKDAEPGWVSPAGIKVLGRPGWHIECSAMSMAKLLSPFGGGLRCDHPEQNIFDIHGGGIDLVFPHHENEVAQSCCAFGSPRMANIFMHNGFVQVEGAKMAKSAGNFITIDQLLRQEHFGGRRWPGAVLRFAMLRTHYRQPIDWTVRGLEEAEGILAKFGEIAADSTDCQPSPEMLSAIADDLNTPEAITHLHGLARQARDATAGDSGQSRAKAQLRSDLDFLGVELSELRASRAVEDGVREKIEALMEQRARARLEKDWAESDRLRHAIGELGAVVKDSKDGSSTWALSP